MQDRREPQQRPPARSRGGPIQSAAARKRKVEKDTTKIVHLLQALQRQVPDCYWLFAFHSRSVDNGQRIYREFSPELEVRGKLPTVPALCVEHAADILAMAATAVRRW